MTKTELMKTYTAEQLAEMVVEKCNRLRSEEKPFGYHYDLGDGRAIRFIGFEREDAETYCKAFEGAKKERDCQIAEYQKKIEELAEERDFISKDSISIYQEPIEIAKDLINAEREYEHNPIAKAFCGTDKGTYRIFDISELRQIAEHLLVYCNHNGEAEE